MHSATIKKNMAPTL